MKKYNRFSTRFLLALVLIFPLSGYSQNIEIINRDNSNVILEKSAPGYSAIIPVSGTGFIKNHIVKDMETLF